MQNYFLAFQKISIYYNCMNTELQNLIKKLGSKKAAAEKLMITIRYIDMLLAGKRPSKRLVQLIKIYLSMA